jgi:hypothetical protein
MTTKEPTVEKDDDEGENKELDMNDTTDLEVVYSGYLMKRDIINTWDVRFVTLCRGTPKRKLAGRIYLVYWSNHNKENFSRGRCELEITNGAASATFDREFYDEGRRGFVFGVQPTANARHRVFDCDSDAVRQKWTEMLTSVGVVHKGLQATKLIHSESIKEGWVNKQPHRGLIWNRRFLTLTSHTCVYTRGRGDTHAQGMIMITPRTLVAVSDKRAFSLRVVSDPTQPANTHPGREFIFQCGDETSFKSWLDAWRTAIKTGSAGASATPASPSATPASPSAASAASSSTTSASV